VDDPQPAVDGGDGSASVSLPPEQQADVDNMNVRTASDASVNPVTGADAGAVPPIEKESKPVSK